MPDEWDQLGTAALAGRASPPSPRGEGRAAGEASAKVPVLLGGPQTDIADEWSALAAPAPPADEWSALATEAPVRPSELIFGSEGRTREVPTKPQGPAPIDETPDATAAELGAFPQLPVNRDTGFGAMLARERERAAGILPPEPAEPPDETALLGPRPIEPFTRGRLSEQGVRNFSRAFFDTPTVPVSKLNISPQQVTDALTPDKASQFPGGLAKATAGTQQAVNGMLEGLTTPFAIATFGTGALLKGAAARILAGLFAADMARHTPEQVKQLKVAIDSGDPEAIARSGVGLGLTATFMFGAAKHAATPDSPGRAAGEMFLKELDNPRSAKQLETAAHEFALKASLPDEWADLGRRVQTREGEAPAEPTLLREATAIRSPKSPAAETITGSNEGVASEMPAEREKRPKPVATSSLTERPWDILDELEATVGGKIDPALIRQADPNWKPVGAARAIFRKGGHAADRALNAITYEGPKLGLKQDTGLQEFGEAINRAALARLRTESKRVEQFERRVLVGERPKTEAANVERVPVEGLVEGDVFKVQDHEFEVRKLEFDEDQNLVSIMVKDGPKFGVQIIEPGRSEFIHIDKGTMKPVPREAWMAPEPIEAFALNNPESVEEQRVRLESEAAARLKQEQAEKLAVEAGKPLVGSRGDIGQRDLLGGGDLFSDPGAPARPRRAAAMGDPINAPVPPNAPAIPAGTPGVAHLFDMRLPVTLPRTAEGKVSIPQVMSALENVITAAGGQTPIRVGRFDKAHARGIYKPREEVTRINSADNIPTATHEIGHASQKLLYGSAYARGLRGLPPAVKRELVALGKALYGNTRPAAGYSGEGWAEFIRHYITTDDAAKLAPATEKYFREKVLVDHPEFGRAVKQARDLVDVYRAQGSVGRAQQQLVKAPGNIARIVKTIRNTLGVQAQVDEFEPLRKLSQGYAERSGNTLAPAADPFLLASWKRGTAGATVETMVNDHMIDPWGNPFYAPGNMSLRQALAPIKGRGEDFALYLFGRRALERWSKNKNPGLTKEDAQYLVSHFDSPEFQLAANNYYEWNRGLLEYVRAADPAMSGTIDAILNSSSDYAPLARVIDPAGATAAAAASRSNPLARMHGSGRQVRDIFETTLENAARMVSHANRKLVLESIVKLSKKEGMGFLVEEVPRSKVRTEVNFEKLRDQLEAAGVDTGAIDENAVLTYFDLADKPKGADPIVVVKEADGLHWYHVSPGVYEILNGLDPVRLHPALDLILGAPARAFRMGATGLRPSFSLFTNPTRDLRTLVMQTQSSANPARLGAAYFSALGEVVRAGFGGKASPHVEAFYRLGAQLGQPLGVDIRHTRRATKELFHGKVMRVVTNPINHLRDLLQITESAPRVAELKLIADDVGWKPGQPMTPDQAVQIAMAAKRVTVDFSAGGRIAKVINQAVPFYNATIQGSRSFVRALRDNPTRAVLYGLATFTVPALLNWYRNKDKEWYRQLPWRERYLYDNIEDGQNVWQIPRPPEWGNLFSVLPEAILDSWYQQDPRGAEEALKHILATTNPLDYPVPLKIAKEQWQNRIEFFDRPIVPRSQVDLPPGEQRGPYSTKLGEWLGNAFPNTVSPRRIDAGVRSYFGGAVPDLLDAVGLGAVKRGREEELSDLPVLGRMFRRGGKFSAANLAIGDYYDDLSRYGARGQAMDAAMREGRPPLNPLDPREYGYWKLLEELRPAFKAASQVADRTSSLSARQSLYSDMAREAAKVTALRPKEKQSKRLDGPPR